MTAALKAQGDTPETFPSRPSSSATARAESSYRKGAWRLDNGYCKDTLPVVFFSGRGPAAGTADCKPNEVAVPSVVGRSAEAATARLALQPLESKIVYAPAKPGRGPGVVIRQYPRSGGLSAHDTVTLVVTKARYGLVPDLVGSSLAAAKVQLRKLRLKVEIVYAKGRERDDSAAEPHARCRRLARGLAIRSSSVAVGARLASPSSGDPGVIIRLALSYPGAPYRSARRRRARGRAMAARPPS